MLGIWACLGCLLLFADQQMTQGASCYAPLHSNLTESCPNPVSPPPPLPPQVPTTLMAVVDAAVGIKTAVNFHEKKNKLGTYQPPLGVLYDTAFLHR